MTRHKHTPEEIDRKILNYLNHLDKKANSTTILTISQGTGITYATIHKHINALEHDGKVTTRMFAGCRLVMRK